MNDTKQQHLDLFEQIIRALRAIVDTVPALAGLGRAVTLIEARHAALKAEALPPEPAPPPAGPQPDHSPDEMPPTA